MLVLAKQASDIEERSQEKEKMPLRQPSTILPTVRHKGSGP